MPNSTLNSIYIYILLDCIILQDHNWGTYTVAYGILPSENISQQVTPYAHTKVQYNKYIYIMSMAAWLINLVVEKHTTALIE